MKIPTDELPLIDLRSCHVKEAQSNLAYAEIELAPGNANVASAYALVAIGHLLAEIVDRMPQYRGAA